MILSETTVIFHVSKLEIRTISWPEFGSNLIFFTMSGVEKSANQLKLFKNEIETYLLEKVLLAKVA